MQENLSAGTSQPWVNLHLSRPELRNPLNVIRNCAYLLNMALSEEADEESVNTLKVLDKQIDAANKIVTDLLDFTRIRPPQQIRADLNTMINECISYQAVPETSRSMLALTDTLPVEQTGTDEPCFSNIISNATVHGRQGENLISMQLKAMTI